MPDFTSRSGPRGRRRPPARPTAPNSEPVRRRPLGSAASRPTPGASMSRKTAAALAFALLACSPAAAPTQDPPKPVAPQWEPPPKPDTPKPEESKEVPPAPDPADCILADTEIVTTASGLKYSVLKKGTGT